MSGCASCRAPLAQGARFCRSCGAPAPAATPPRALATASEPVCPTCAVPVTPDARFCRACGTALEEETLAGTGGPTERPLPAGETETDPGPANGDAADEPTIASASSRADEATVPLRSPPQRSCEICGGAVDGPGTVCASCTALTPAPDQGPPRDAHPAGTPAAGPPPPRPSAAPTLPTPTRSRGRFYALVAAVALLFAAAGGTGAYFLLASEDEDAPGGSAAMPRGGDSAAADPQAQPESDPEADTTTPTPPEDATAPEDETDAGPEPDSATPTAAAVGGGPSFRAASRVLRRHWTLIDRGDYDGAFALFHPDWRAGSGRAFVKRQRRGGPQVDLDSLEIEPSGRRRGSLLSMRVEVVAADTAGGGAGLCRRFAGSVRMQLSGGRWTYRPGELGGRRPGFKQIPVADGDERCLRVAR